MSYMVVVFHVIIHTSNRLFAERGVLENFRGLCCARKDKDKELRSKDQDV